MPGQGSSRGSEVWLATPDAADYLDPSRRADTDRDALAAIRTPRRRVDWASSRALLDAVPVGADRRSSLSHSHGYAALALVADSVAVGVDVEWLAPRDFVAMANFAYAAAEAAHLATLDDPADLCATFYQFWTLKEALAKALRLPLTDALRGCCLVDPSGARRAVIPTSRPWRAMVFAPRPQLRLAVAFVTESAATLPEALSTMEWPRPRGREWPTIMDLWTTGPGQGSW
jgi:hypothetical protein